VASWLAPGGAFSVVLQLADGRPVTTPIASLRAVGEAMRLVPPEELRSRAAEAGLAERVAYVVPLPTGRRLFTALYQRAMPASGSK
jgi:hypothetical protein